MARSKYTFEKRMREKAKRQKQIEKSAQRMMAKKSKAGGETGTAGEGVVSAEPAGEFLPPAENGDATGRE